MMALARLAFRGSPAPPWCLRAVVVDRIGRPTTKTQRHGAASFLHVIAVIVLAGAALLCAVPSAGQILLRDVTAETGITFKHTDGGCGRRYIMETVSAGLALFDYDRDGDADIYFLSGAPLRGTKVEVLPRNR